MKSNKELINVNSFNVISYREKKYVYQFTNIRAITAEAPLQMFTRCGYDRADVKTAPIASLVKDKIIVIVKRF